MRPGRSLNAPQGSPLGVFSKTLEESACRSTLGNSVGLPSPNGCNVDARHLSEICATPIEGGSDSDDIEVVLHNAEYAKRKLSCQREMHTKKLQNAFMSDQPFDDRPAPALRLEQARLARGFERQKDATEYFGWNYVSYTQHESGERGLSRAAAKYASGYKVSEGWLLTGEGQGPDGQRFAPERPTVTLVPGRELISSNQKMPVYAAAMGGNGHIIISFDLIDEIKRPAELENVKGGYGLLIKGESMVPALWEGDMALVNPHLRPARDFNHVFYHEPPHGSEVEAMVKQLTGFNDRDWSLKQWNPVKEWKESRQVWQTCHRIVGKYDRR